MNEQDLIMQLKKVHRGAPRETWLLKTRQEFFARAMKGMVKPERAASFSPLVFLRGFAFSPVFKSGFAVLFISSFVAASAAMGMRGILPSSPFYSVKLVFERAEGTLAFTEEQKADHGLAVVQERIQELALLSRNTASDPDSLKQTALIAKTVQRYTQAVDTSARTVKQIQKSGNGDLARRKAEELDKTVRAYTVLLSSFDTASSSLLVFEDATTASKEAQSAIEDILMESSANDLPSPAAASPEDSLSPSFSTNAISPSGAPALEIPAVLPNVVE